MTHPVKIENDAVRMEVWPQTGGKVSSVIDKADGFELLFSYPAELPENPLYDVEYGHGWYAGWDECFPAVAPSKYVGHPYEGISVPDHGELWGIPTMAVPTRDGITTVWHGLRFGYRLTRKLYLDDAAVVADYTLVNLSPFNFKFVWALHSLMSLVAPVQLDLPSHGLFRLSHDHQGTDIQKTFEWPIGPEKEDFTKPADLPPRRGWKLFSADPIESPLVVRYPTRSRTLQVEYHSDDELAAYWGIWISTGGWSAHRHFAIEPTTGRFDQIDRAEKDRSAGNLPGSGRLDWSVRWSMA
jgi:hypothetical protein